MNDHFFEIDWRIGWVKKGCIAAIHFATRTSAFMRGRRVSERSTWRRKAAILYTARPSPHHPPANRGSRKISAPGGSSFDHVSR